MNKIDFKGRYVLEHIRDGRVLNRFEFPNGVTNEGKNHALNVIFNAETQITAWYQGLINNGSYSALASSDTMSSHAGWIEWTSYTESTRPVWDSDTSTAQSTANSTQTVFTINVTGVLVGAFVCSNSTKAGTSGKLWATALFGSTISVVSGDIIRNTYTVNAT